MPSGEVKGLISLVTVATATSSLAKRTSMAFTVSVVPFRKVWCTARTSCSVASRPLSTPPLGFTWYQSSVA